MSGSTGRGAGRQARPAARSAGRIGTDADAAGRSRRHGAVRRSGPVPGTTLHSILAAKLAIADYLGRPLAKLAAEDLGYIDALLQETLERRTIITCVR